MWDTGGTWIAKKPSEEKKDSFFSKVFCFVSNKRNMIYFPFLTTVFEHEPSHSFSDHF